MSVRRAAAALALLLALPLGAVATSSPASASPPSCSYGEKRFGSAIGEYLAEYQPGKFCLSSPDGSHWAVFQSDGNFVLYSLWGGAHATWSAGSAQRGRYLAFQGDGNVVVYELDYYQKRRAVWASYTRSSNARLVVQNDGNMVVYQYGGGALWSTRTNGS